MRVLAAMSGGVDSAVAAALAVDAGHDVTGVHLALSPDRQTLRSGARGCCSVEDAHDARRVADELGIPFYVWDLADRFREDVVDDFVAEYAAGRTPNPCLRCNEKIKFTAVLDRARALGFDAVVTGHHARLSDGALRRSVDAAKDQSYVLGVLTAEQLATAMFPLGSMTKERVREIAAERGFAVAAKPDSHDICFIPDGDTRGFLARRLGSLPGPVVDAATGATVGEHDGTYGFTVGQRRGLGIAVGDQRPRYVLGIEPVSRTVTVGTADLAGVGEVRTGPADVDRRRARRCRSRRRCSCAPTRRRCDCAVAADGDGGLRIALADGAARGGARAVRGAVRGRTASAATGCSARGRSCAPVDSRRRRAAEAKVAAGSVSSRRIPSSRIRAEPDFRTAAQDRSWTSRASGRRTPCAEPASPWPSSPRAATVVAVPTPAGAQPGDVPVQLIAMNDFHGRISLTTGGDSQLVTAPGPDGVFGENELGESDDVVVEVGGSANVAATVQRLQTEFRQESRGAAASFFVGAGDLISASPFESSVFKDEPTIEVLNAMGLDVSSVGNHEFDRGTEELRRISAATDGTFTDDVTACEGVTVGVDGCFGEGEHAFTGAEFPYLAANVLAKDTGEPMLPPYQVFHAPTGLRMALIGVVTETTPTIVSPTGITDVEFVDEADAVNEWVPILQADGIEAIGVLIHEGGEATGPAALDPNGCDQLEGAILDINDRIDPAVDLVVSAHTHQAYNCLLPVAGGEPRLVTQAGFYGRLVSDIRLTLDRETGDVDRAATYAATNVPVTREAPDLAVQAIVDDWNARRRGRQRRGRRRHRRPAPGPRRRRPAGARRRVGARHLRGQRPAGRGPGGAGARRSRRRLHEPRWPAHRHPLRRQPGGGGGRAGHLPGAVRRPAVQQHRQHDDPDRRRHQGGPRTAVPERGPGQHPAALDVRRLRLRVRPRAGGGRPRVRLLDHHRRRGRRPGGHLPDRGELLPARRR